METKFEYQVSPELAEKIAIEQFDVLLRIRGVKLRYLPIGMGFLLALFLLLTPGAINLSQSRYPFAPNYFQMGHFAFTEDFLSVPIGFVFGFGIGFLLNLFVRSRILAMARSAYAKMGPARTVSWNSESITFQSPVYETKVHWQMIDRIEVGCLGVYGLSGRRALFAIPRDAFPPNATIEELTRAWQPHRTQPSIKA